MPNMLPFFRIRSPSGSCWESNNCATKHYVETLRASEYEWDQGCSDCCPECLDGTYTTPAGDDVWWNTGTGNVNRAQGLWIDELNVEPYDSVRRRGDTGETTAAYTPRRLELTGVLFAQDAQSMARLRNELSRRLNLIDDTEGWTIELQAFCSDTPPPVGGGEIDDWEQDIPPTLDPFDGVCDEFDPCARTPDTYQARRLTATAQTPESFDDGARRLIGLRFVSFDDIDNSGDSPSAPCEGQPVQIVFELLDDVTLGSRYCSDCPGDPDSPNPGWDTLESGRCRPYDFRSKRGVPSSDDTCPDDPLATIPAGLVGVRSATAAPSTTAGSTPSYCTPMMRSVRACLTPLLPSGDDVRVSIELDSGSAEARNVAVKIWPAWNGWPSPETCEGEALYETIRPCEAPFFVPYMPAHSVMTIDGEAESVWLSCFGAARIRAEDRIQTLGAALAFPTLKGDCRYWVYISTDCFNRADDFAARLCYTPIQRPG